MTPAEIVKAALADRQIALHVASKDPRVQLLEILWRDQEFRQAVRVAVLRLFPNHGEEKIREDILTVLQPKAGSL